MVSALGHPEVIDSEQCNHPQAQTQATPIPHALVELLLLSKPDWTLSYFCSRFNFAPLSVIFVRKWHFSYLSAIQNMQIAQDMPDP